MQETKITRRRFVQGGGVVMGALALPSAQAADARKSVARLRDVQPGKPVAFAYPEAEPAYLIDLGKPTPGGIGPKRSIVAFSALCQHMGCPTNYDAKTGHFVCPCHASVFDSARNGACIEGPSTRGLPRISLRLEGDAIYATGVEGGVVYGRACNHA